MCGIAGILGRIDARNRGALERMAAAMVHRGPDDAGSWESTPGPDGHGALLTFRRLSILDLSPAGHQPMVDPVGGTRPGLQRRGLQFQDAPGAAGPLGPDLPVHRGRGGGAPQPRARGAGGAALLPGDVRLRLLGPAGADPAAGPGPAGHQAAVRGPEPRPGRWLVRGLRLRGARAPRLGAARAPRLDRWAAASVAWNGFVVGPRTAVQGVESLLPGELALYREDGSLVRSGAYWSLPPAGSGPVASEEELAAVLEESVRLHLVSDVPLGVFLSGGIDSSSVANLARRAARGPVHTFTLAFEEEEYNEGHAARAIAQAIGTEHQEVLLTEERFLGQMEQALDSLDQPTFDGLNSYFMSRAVRDAGFTVALVGTGGDELFGGYTSFHDLPVLQRWSRRLSWLPRAALVRMAELALVALQREQGAIPRQTRWAKLPEMVRRGTTCSRSTSSPTRCSSPSSSGSSSAPSWPRLWWTGSRRRSAPGWRPRCGAGPSWRPSACSSSGCSSGERLLRDNDAASMAASIEQRLPLVDQVLLETVLRLPDASRYEPVLRKAMLRRQRATGLDPALFERPKRGFVLPYERWIRQGLSGDVDRTLRDPEAVRAAGLQPEAVARLWEAFRAEAPGLYWSRVWAIYVLVRWCRVTGCVRERAGGRWSRGPRSWPARSARPWSPGSGSARIAGPGASYVCPMHPDVRRAVPGDCPVCGMALVAAAAPGVERSAAAGSVLGLPPGTVEVARRRTLTERRSVPAWVEADGAIRALVPEDAVAARARGPCRVSPGHRPGPGHGRPAHRGARGPVGRGDLEGDLRGRAREAGAPRGPGGVARARSTGPGGAHAPVVRGAPLGGWSLRARRGARRRRARAATGPARGGAGRAGDAALRGAGVRARRGPRGLLPRCGPAAGPGGRGRRAVIERAIGWSSRHPWGVLGAALLFVVAAEAVRRSAPADVLPELSDPRIGVVVEWMGHSASEVSEKLTAPVIRLLSPLEGATAVRGASMSGMAYLDVVLAPSTEAASARRAVLQRLEEARSALPVTARVQVGPVASSTGWVFQYALFDPTHAETRVSLRRLQDSVLRPALAALPGVAEVATVGGETEEVVIDVGSEQLRSRGLALSEVTASVRAALAAELHGEPGHLARAAHPRRGPAPRRRRLRIGRPPPTGLADFGGQYPAVGGIVVADRGANVPALLAEVHRTVDGLRSGLPPGVKLLTVHDRSG